MKIVDCTQGEEDWFRARMGRPTASMFGTVLASGRNGGVSETRRKYLYRLAGEIISGAPEESYSNGHMERGKVQEGEARDLYAFMTNASPEIVGFVMNEKAGASPDSFVGSDGMLEIKSKLPSLLIDWIMSNQLPSEHKAQVQGGLWVCEREWCDLFGYAPNMPPFTFRAHRDDLYIAKLASEVDHFCDELAMIVDHIRRYAEAA